MKNLKTSTAISFDIDLQSEDESLLCSAFDVERNRVFFASSANVVYGLQFSSPQKGKSGSKATLSTNSEQVFLEPDNRIVAMEYLMEKEALIIGTLNGCLVLHTVDLKTTEVVGRVEGGVKNISASPDGALLAVTAGLGQLLVMTHDWEVLTTKESGASASSTTASKARDLRRQRKKGGKIRAGSPGEEMALVDHLKDMSLTAGAQRELKSLLVVLLMLGKEDICRQLQQVADTFQLSQDAAMKLTEDTIASESIDETTQTLEHYMRKLREVPRQSRVLSWQSKVLLPP